MYRVKGYGKVSHGEWAILAWPVCTWTLSPNSRSQLPFFIKGFFKVLWARALIILLPQQGRPLLFCSRDSFTLDPFWFSVYSLVMPSLNLFPSSRIQTLILGYSACLWCKPFLPTYNSNLDPWGSRVWALHLSRMNSAMHHNSYSQSFPTFSLKFCDIWPATIILYWYDKNKSFKKCYSNTQFKVLLSIYVYVCEFVNVPMEAREVLAPGNWSSKQLWAVWCGCWESGLLWEQYVFLTTEQLCQPIMYIFDEWRTNLISSF